MVIVGIDGSKKGVSATKDHHHNDVVFVFVAGEVRYSLLPELERNSEWRERCAWRGRRCDLCCHSIASLATQGAFMRLERLLQSSEQCSKIVSPRTVMQVNYQTGCIVLVALGTD